MKDIDFDELDRAVSSVLGQKTPEDTGTSVAVDSTPVVAADDTAVTVETNTEVAETPSESAPVETPEVKTPSVAAPLAVKRRGKFMDMIHPSADMKPGTPAALPTKSAPKTLTPLTAPAPTPDVEDATTETQPDDAPVALLEPASEPTASVDESKALIGAEPAPVETDLLSESNDSEPSSEADDTVPAADTPPASDATDEPAPDTQKSVYVDPLELDAKRSTADVTDEQSTDESEESQSTDTDPASSQLTPFLTDTKVDKRPLGAFGDAENPAAAEPSGAPEVAPGPETGSPSDTQGAPVVPLPRELQPDVVEVESVQEPEETPAAPAASAAAGPFAANVAVDAPESDGRVEGHPLFDTSTYHEPIAAVKTKSTPAWVWWLVGLTACLAVGSGVGYLLFTAGL